MIVIVAITLSLATGLGWWLRHQFLVVTVHGPSMRPTYRDGDRVLVRRRPRANLRPGHVVVVDVPARERGAGVRTTIRASTVPGKRVVKRVAAVARDWAPRGVGCDLFVPEGKLAVLGDNAEASVDSRVFGYVEAERVVGVVVRRINSK